MAHFRPVDSRRPCKYPGEFMTATATIAKLETAITADNYTKVVAFYRAVGGLEVVSEHDDFTILRDAGTGQSLVISSGCPAPGVHMELTVVDIPAAVKAVESAGGSALDVWEKAAWCKDVEGNHLMLLSC